VDEIGNLIEAGLWGGVAVGMSLAAALAARPWRRTCMWLAPVFLVFGVSDLIEAQTGAWWRPWWLLALKAACVLAIAVGLRRLHAIAKRQTARRAGQPGNARR
jgi:uncharacterized membrane protein YhaH (DUF805 family)